MLVAHVASISNVSVHYFILVETLEPVSSTFSFFPFDLFGGREVGFCFILVLSGTQ